VVQALELLKRTWGFEGHPAYHTECGRWSRWSCLGSWPCASAPGSPLEWSALLKQGYHSLMSATSQLCMCCAITCKKNQWFQHITSSWRRSCKSAHMGMLEMGGHLTGPQPHSPWKDVKIDLGPPSSPDHKFTTPPSDSWSWFRHGPDWGCGPAMLKWISFWDLSIALFVTICPTFHVCGPQPPEVQPPPLPTPWLSIILQPPCSFSLR